MLGNLNKQAFPRDRDTSNELGHAAILEKSHGGSLLLPLAIFDDKEHQASPSSYFPFVHMLSGVVFINYGFTLFSDDVCLSSCQNKA